MKGSYVNRDSLPPGGVKMVEALRKLLGEKEFNAITTAEIAMVAGVNEALIYKYFGSKRELLHAVLLDYSREFLANIQLKLKGIKGVENKLRKLLWEYIYMYQTEPVIGKILVLEVRNYLGYFDTEIYKLIKGFTKKIKALIEEGIENGDFRNDISSWTIMQVILGAIEHLCMPKIIFGREISADDLTEDLFNMVIDGIRKKGNADTGS